MGDLDSGQQDGLDTKAIPEPAAISLNSRRKFLRVGGALALTAAVVVGAREAQANLRGFSSDLKPEKPLLNTRKTGKPAIPALEIVVFNRLALGWRPGDLEEFRKLPGSNSEKLRTWTELQLNPAKIADADCDAKLANLESLNKPLEVAWADYYKNLDEKDDKKYQKMGIPTLEARLATITRMVFSKRQLLEVMVDFWHNHFNVHPERDDSIKPTFMSYDRDVIRANVFGNFRVMLEAVAKHPAMLRYLDNASSNRAGPNENYARELFELHTMGAENYRGVGRQRDVAGYAQGQPEAYVDDDVYEATRCFTGWRIDDNNDEPGFDNTGQFTFFQPWHDRFQKTVLGRYLPPDQPSTKDGQDVLDALAAHPGTARYIARKLVRRLISDKPPQNVVDAAAKVFLEKKDAPDQMKFVIRSIVLSKEFASTWSEKIKRPLERYISGLRVLETDIKFNEDMLWTTYYMGQALFDHRPPDGYPDYREAWASSSGLLRSWQFMNGIAQDWDEKYQSGVMKTNANRRTPLEIADFWLERLLGRKPHPLEIRDDLIKFLADDGDPNLAITDDDTLKWRVQSIVGFILMSPDFMWK
jgi:uncharacterized protein (DUF1800 family)